MAKRHDRRSGTVVTIHDVARHAGVSPMTVSRVLNCQNTVREETRAKVSASIKLLRYSPNLAARSLASVDTHHIGVLYNNSVSAPMAEILLGCLEQARLSGCQLVIEQCEEMGRERECVERLVKGGVHGVLLPAPLGDCQNVVKALAQADIPAILVASPRPVAGCSAVSISDFEASRAMTRYLLSHGHKRIGFILGDRHQSASTQRFRGFVEAMSEAGLNVDNAQLAQGYGTYRSALKPAEQLLNSYHPTAIFACNDAMAAAAMASAHRMGLEVPGELAIAGFDDSPLASTLWPELTTIGQPIAEMAREAVRILIEQIRARRSGLPVQTIHKVLKFSLIKRESTMANTERNAPRRVLTGNY